MKQNKVSKHFVNCKFVIMKDYIDKNEKCNFDTLATLPTKTHDSDVGYDLSILKKAKDLNETTALYHTGLKATIVENEFYLEIVPRSSISKSGYVMSNSFGVIDPSYS
jgi:dUTP pyrophosphatase